MYVDPGIIIDHRQHYVQQRNHESARATIKFRRIGSKRGCTFKFGTRYVHCLFDLTFSVIPFFSSFSILLSFFFSFSIISQHSLLSWDIETCRARFLVRFRETNNERCKTGMRDERGRRKLNAPNNYKNVELILLYRPISL